MILYDVMFYLLAAMILVSASVVVFSKNIMYSAFSLLVTFFGVAGIYVLLNADFLAITQIMIYIGGILVLIIFGVMLTVNVKKVEMKTGTFSRIQKWLISLVTLILAVLLSVLFTTVDWHKAEGVKLDETIKPIGTVLLTNYLIAFEVASVLLLIAIIGAALIARKNK